MSKLDRWILGLVASVGALLPWATGAGVKLYLQAHGKPTLPWSAFVAPTDLLLEIPLTLWFASPYLVLAFVARAVFRDKRVPFLTTTSSGERRALVLLSLGLGSVCTIVTFKGIFWAFDPLYFVTPIPIALPTVGIVVGWAVGLVVLMVTAHVRRRGHAIAEEHRGT
jgi:hypothetical protein